MMYRYQLCGPVFRMSIECVCAWFDAFWVVGRDVVIFWSDKIGVVTCKHDPGSCLSARYCGRPFPR